MRKIDITGKDFGFLHVNYFNEQASKETGKSMWNCTCSCGKTKNCESYNLRNGRTVSCGCRRTDRPHITHGKTKTIIYRKWQSMKRRCNNPKEPHYSYYGGRGISVCKEWEKDFSAFYEWSISNGYEPGLSIDRIDFNGNYEPNNCRWVTIAEQQTNKRNIIIVSVCGMEKTLQEWSKIYNIPVEALRERYKKGKKEGIEDFPISFLKPSSKCNNKKVVQLTMNGETVNIWDSAKEACTNLNLNESNLRRCCRGERKSYNGYIWKYDNDSQFVLNAK